MAKKSLARTTISIGANVAGLQRGLKTASASIKRFGGQAKRIGTTFSAAFTAPLAAIGVQSVKTFQGFEAEMSKVKAVSGATAEQFAKLESEAKRLGATTTFTASEVASLQTEFAKLGFSANEITQVTESTLYLAQAAGTDLARAAEVAGATLRGFGMDATETGHLTDVMAQSFSESALDMESFAEAMKYVAPVASSAGISVEETTGMIELLANAGIKGSQAGTSLRRIISQLGATGGDVAGTIKKLASEGINLADAKDEVGRSAQSALLVLSDTIDQLPALTEGLKGADGAASAMAATMMDNTVGAFKTLQSASEGVQIEIGEAIANNEIFKNVLNKLTEQLGKVTQYIRSMTEAEAYNKVVLSGLIAVVPLVITAVGGLTLAFGSLTAAMGPLAIALTGVVMAYQLLKKEVTETDQAIKDALSNENITEGTAQLKQQLKLVERNLANSRKWAAEQPKNVSYQRNIARLEKEQLALKEALGSIEAKQAKERETWRNAEKEHTQEIIEKQKVLAQAHAETGVHIKNNAKEYSSYSVIALDSLTRMGEKFAEIEQKALSYNSVTTGGLKQAIDLTGGLAYEFSANLSNAIAGAIVNGDNFAESFITALKAMAAQLIATIALVAILAALLVVATGGFSGLSLQSLGVGMKAVSKSAGIAVPFLAEGGIVTGPTLAMIGEGRESEAVIPLSKLPQIAGATGGAVEVYGRLSGQDILLSTEKANRTRSRYRGF